MSDEQGKDGGKHAEPNWPEDTGKTFDDWLEESNRKAEGG